MIDAKTLNKCIDYLSVVNANSNNPMVKNLILEIGYVLKQELDNVKAWDNNFAKNNKPAQSNIDVKKLMEDNTQLYNDNIRLEKIIINLQNAIDKKIPDLENMTANVRDKITTLKEELNK